MFTDDDVPLEHFGVKGMRWGVRNEAKSQSSTAKPKMSNTKKAAIVLGSAAAAGAILAGAVYAKRHMGVKLSDISDASNHGKRFAEAITQEPVGIVHAARGRSLGFTFLGHGGLSSPLKEYERAGFNRRSSGSFVQRYGDRSEKVAARFLDPEGRRDRSGREIFHEVMLPESLANGVSTLDQVVSRAWPLIRDVYGAIYDS